MPEEEDTMPDELLTLTEPWYSAEQVGSLLGVTDRAVRNYARETGLRKRGRDWLFAAEEVRALYRTMRAKPRPGRPPKPKEEPPIPQEDEVDRWDDE